MSCGRNKTDCVNGAPDGQCGRSSIRRKVERVKAELEKVGLWRALSAVAELDFDRSAVGRQVRGSSERERATGASCFQKDDSGGCVHRRRLECR